MVSSRRDNGNLHAVKVVCKLRGTVIPKALLFALPNAIFATVLKLVDRADKLPEEVAGLQILKNSAAYSGFTFAMGFLFVFRTSQAYARFWEGCTSGHKMYAEWFDFAAAAVAFTKYSKAGEQAVSEFHHRLVRLLSLLHAAAVASLRGLDGSRFEFIDIEGLDSSDVKHVMESQFPVTLISQWVLELVMEGLHDGILAAPPPLVSRCFQEFANGLVEFHEAQKIQTTRFPFPYQQMTGLMLLSHWCITPFVMVMWIRWPSWVFILTLLQTLVFWALYFTALEIENPFQHGEITSNYAAQHVQKEFNAQLLMIIDPKTRLTPVLSDKCEMRMDVLQGLHEEHALRLGANAHPLEDLAGGASSSSLGGGLRARARARAGGQVELDLGVISVSQGLRGYKRPVKAGRPNPQPGPADPGKDTGPRR